jgi:hypothetical protein
MRIEEAREDQVVFEQATARAPAQAGTVGGIGLMRIHTRVRCSVNTIPRLPAGDSTVVLLYLLQHLARDTAEISLFGGMLFQP